MCKHKEGEVRCKRAHHSDLHESKSDYCEANAVAPLRTDKDRLGYKSVVLMAIQDVWAGTRIS